MSVKDQEEVPRVSLTGLSGAYRDKVYKIDKEEFLIGRIQGCDLHMAENTISGKHARIIKVRDFYEIEDMQSTNGTFLNGVRITRKRLRSWDKIKIDKYEFQFIDMADASRTIVSTQTDLLEAQRAAAQEQPPQRVIPQAPVPVSAKGGSLFGGAVLAVLAAFLIGLGGNLVLQQVRMSGENAPLSSTTSHLKALALAYPAMHQVHLWTKADLGQWPDIVSILLIVLSLLLGGILTQSFSPRGRPASALTFSLFFVLGTLLLQLALLQFQFSGLPLFFASLGQNLSPWLAYGLGAAYFFGVVFILSLLGTYFVRARR